MVCSIVIRSDLYKGNYPLTETITKQNLHLLLNFRYQVRIKTLVKSNRLQEIKKPSKNCLSILKLVYNRNEKDQQITRNRMYREVIRSLLSMYQRPAASLYISNGSRPYKTHYKTIMQYCQIAVHTWMALTEKEISILQIIPLCWHQLANGHNQSH